MKQILPNMSDQEKKRQRIYDLLNAETKPNFLCLPYKKQKKFLIEKELFEEKGWEGLDQKKKKKRKEGFLTALASVIKNNLTTPIRKNAK